MVKMLPVLAGAAMLAASVTVASAEELRLSEQEMDQVTAGFSLALAASDADASALNFGLFGGTATVTYTDTYANAFDGIFVDYAESGSYSASGALAF